KRSCCPEVVHVGRDPCSRRGRADRRYRCERYLRTQIKPDHPHCTWERGLFSFEEGSWCYYTLKDSGTVLGVEKAGIQELFESEQAECPAELLLWVCVFTEDEPPSIVVRQIDRA